MLHCTYFLFRKYSICTVDIFDFLFDPHFPDKLYSVHAAGSQAGLYFLYPFISKHLSTMEWVEFVICLIFMNAYICSLISKALSLCRYDFDYRATSVLL